MSLEEQGYALGAGGGESYWFFNALTTLKAGGRDTHDAFTLMEFVIPPSFGPPPHIHHREDEGFYLLEGEFTVTCGDTTWPPDPALLSCCPGASLIPSPHGTPVP